MQAGNRIAAKYAGTSFDHTNVTNGQRYYYVVTEVSAAGEGPASRIVSATPYAALPSAPFGLKVTALDSSVKLDFLVPTPATTASVSYNLYRSTTITGLTAASKIASSLTALTYNDNNPQIIKNGTTYYYALTTVVAGKESAFCPIAAARPQATTPAVDNTPENGLLAAFSSPTDMSVTPGNRSCTIKWTEVLPLKITGADTVGSTSPVYILYWSNSPDVIANKISQRVIDSNDMTSDGFTLTGLNNSATYYFQIAAAIKKDAAGALIQGRYTTGPVVAATPGLKIPAIPSGVSATQGAQQVALSWSKDNSGLSGITYNIYVSTTDADSPAELMARAISMDNKKNNVDSSKTNYTLSGQPGTTYYFVITAAVGEGESAPSSIVTISL
jgi:fibronectin type 3 domain-containing protein